MKKENDKWKNGKPNEPNKIKIKTNYSIGCLVSIELRVELACYGMFSKWDMFNKIFVPAKLLGFRTEWIAKCDSIDCRCVPVIHFHAVRVDWRQRKQGSSKQKKLLPTDEKLFAFSAKFSNLHFFFVFFLFSHLVWRWMQKKTGLEVGNYEWKLFCCHSNHIPITAIPDEFVHRNENHLPRTADSKYDSTSKWNEKKQLFFVKMKNV